ncbi:hypothetical protein SEA_BOILGATE_82 [Mycobacterium phage Boilgate]|nr:hypothetical protein SEA_BOILGATE_82 [Mycobacterium phage Boilgate]
MAAQIASDAPDTPGGTNTPDSLIRPLTGEYRPRNDDSTQHRPAR